MSLELCFVLWFKWDLIDLIHLEQQPQDGWEHYPAFWGFLGYSCVGLDWKLPWKSFYFSFILVLICPFFVLNLVFAVFEPGLTSFLNLAFNAKHFYFLNSIFTPDLTWEDENSPYFASPGPFSLILLHLDEIWVPEGYFNYETIISAVHGWLPCVFLPWQILQEFLSSENPFFSQWGFNFLSPVQFLRQSLEMWGAPGIPVEFCVQTEMFPWF